MGALFHSELLTVESQVLRTLLVELTDERALRFQVFAGVSSAPGFTDAARIYRR